MNEYLQKLALYERSLSPEQLQERARVRLAAHTAAEKACGCIDEKIAMLLALIGHIESQIDDLSEERLILYMGTYDNSVEGRFLRYDLADWE